MKQIPEYRQKSLVRQAEQLLHDENLLRLPVDLEALAKSRKIYVRAMDSAEKGVSGMLLRHGDMFGILYSASIPNLGFMRFSIAHELGHYFIDGHLDQIPFDGNTHSSWAGFVSSAVHEREADYFAAGLLMPTTPVRRIIDGTPAGLCSVEAVQREAEASLTAAAIRYVALADNATAVVVSRNGSVDYCFMSDTMKSLKELTWLRKGMPIPPDTLTESILDQSEEEQLQARSEGEVDIATWFEGRRSVTAWEEVIGLGGYGRVLTILTCPDLVDEVYMEEDDDSDEALEESWTPRFRR